MEKLIIYILIVLCCFFVICNLTKPISEKNKIVDSFIDLEIYHINNYLLLKKSTKDSITLQKIDSILLIEKKSIIKMEYRGEKLDSLLNILL